uniref:Uncharacterized protein n=1 Tax=Timema genevievae TaxID=629358 RepID=A0A7R9JPH9_TIMGE|nr:unnamed protein product [Timema genevievae]
MLLDNNKKVTQWLIEPMSTTLSPDIASVLHVNDAPFSRKSFSLRFLVKTKCTVTSRFFCRVVPTYNTMATNDFKLSGRDEKDRLVTNLIGMTLKYRCKPEDSLRDLVPPKQLGMEAKRYRLYFLRDIYCIFFKTQTTFFETETFFEIQTVLSSREELYFLQETNCTFFERQIVLSSRDGVDELYLLREMGCTLFKRQTTFFERETFFDVQNVLSLREGLYFLRETDCTFFKTQTTFFETETFFEIHTVLSSRDRDYFLREMDRIKSNRCISHDLTSAIPVAYIIRRSTPLTGSGPNGQGAAGGTKKHTEVYPHFRVGPSRKQFFWKITINTPDRGFNLDLPIIGSPVYCEGSVLDHAATGAGAANFKAAASVSDKISIAVKPHGLKYNGLIGSVAAFGWREGIKPFWEKKLGTPSRDSNLDLSFIGSLVYCERSGLDHEATEAGYPAGGLNADFSVTD